MISWLMYVKCLWSHPKEFYYQFEVHFLEGNSSSNRGHKSSSVAWYSVTELYLKGYDAFLCEFLQFLAITLPFVDLGKLSDFIGMQ